MMHLNHLVTALAVALLLINGGLYFKVVENAQIRSETHDFEKVAASIQSQFAAKQQQFQAQEEKLKEGSAIVKTVGPAVVADMSGLAQKSPSNPLRDLVQKYGVSVKESPPGAAGQPVSGPAAAKRGGN